MARQTQYPQMHEDLKMHDGSEAKMTGYTAAEKEIAEGLVSSAYEALLILARNRRRRAGFRDTMMTEDILHESFLKLSGKSVWESPEHFMRSASLAIRQVIVDHARARLTAKRGGGERNFTFDECAAVLPEFNETPEQIVMLNDLLAQLGQENSRWLRIVDARYFAGMTEVETAHLLGLSERTVRREWKAAKAWLAERMV